MNIPVLTWSITLIVIGAVGAILEFRRLRGIERTLMILAMIAVTAVGVVGIAKAWGYLTDPNLYLTLNIALPVLFCGLSYQVHLRRKRDNTVR